LSKGGIPLANGDVQLPKPPPWAYPLWSQHETQNYETDRMLKSTSHVIDQAMAQLWEAKVKFVNVSFSIKKLGRSRSLVISDTRRRLRHTTTDSHDPEEDPEGIGDQPIEWVKVTLSTVPGVNMDDVDGNEPTRKKDHRRVPSTIAIEEVKVRLTYKVHFSIHMYFFKQLEFFFFFPFLSHFQLMHLFQMLLSLHYNNFLFMS
jgi:phosphatidylinositol 4-kinase B